MANRQHSYSSPPQQESLWRRPTRILPPKMPFLPIDHPSTFARAESILEAAISKEPFTTPASSFFMRSYLLLRSVYNPGAPNLPKPAFFASPCLRCYARIQHYSPTAVTVTMCVVPAAAVEDEATLDDRSDVELHRNAVEAIADLLEPAVKNVNVHAVSDGPRSQDWLAVFCDSHAFSVTIDSCLWYAEDPARNSTGPIHYPTAAKEDTPELILSRLQAEDMPLLAENWPYTCATGSAFLERVTECLPSACLRPAYAASRAGDGRKGAETTLAPPVGWILCYPDGTIGALHILEDWRRRGLAKRLIAAQCENVRRTAAQRCPEADVPRIYSVVVSSNIRSKRLFDSLPSWRRADEKINWLLFSKRSAAR